MISPRAHFLALTLVALLGFHPLVLYGAAGAASIENHSIRVEVDPSAGTYSIYSQAGGQAVLRSGFGAEVDRRWLHSDQYPKNQLGQAGEFHDQLGDGHEIVLRSTGLAGAPDLICTLRLYDNLPFGTVSVQAANSSGSELTVQAIQTVRSIGNPPFDLGGPLQATRVLSDSFSEDRPVLRIRDLSDAPDGMHRATGSQLLYNRQSKQSLFLGAMSSSRFVTLLHLRGKKDSQGRFLPESYTVDSTGTTEILKSESLSESDPKDQIELSLPLAPGEAMDSEPLMFAVDNDYHRELENYGKAIRTLHHPRPAPSPLIGWWSWTAFYFSINEGSALTNAEWMAQHLKNEGYVYVHLDEGYDYARGEYTTPDASHFPQGIKFVSAKLAAMGLRLGLWTAPFEVSERSWVYQNHKDWLVKNAEHEPIHIGHVTEKQDQLYVLDTTNPEAQAYLRQTYQTLAHDWHVGYIKMDFMDDTAIEGFYHRPNTTALEAQRIGLKIIRDAVGNDVVLDKDGSPMLNPVGIVDTGRISADTGHAFAVIKDDADGIAARYYMNNNFFVADPDAYSVSKQLVIDPDWHERVRSMSLDEAQVAITLAAIAGGMFELGDDLTTLARDKDRLDLVRNPALLDMIRLGRSATPVDLMTYRDEDEQPGIFILRESPHQSVLAVFNWTEHTTSHNLSLAELGFDQNGSYTASDVFDSLRQVSLQGGAIALNAQAPHSVRVLKIINSAAPATPPVIEAHVPAEFPVAIETEFSAEPESDSSTATIFHWHFDDGVTTDGRRVHHAYALPGPHHVVLHVESADGAPFAKTFDVSVTGKIDTHFKPQENRRYEPTGPEPH